jgi:hypothetical protein
VLESQLLPVGTFGKLLDGLLLAQSREAHPGRIGLAQPDLTRFPDVANALGLEAQ